MIDALLNGAFIGKYGQSGECEAVTPSFVGIIIDDYKRRIM